MILARDVDSDTEHSLIDHIFEDLQFFKHTVKIKSEVLNKQNIIKQINDKNLLPIRSTKKVSLKARELIINAQTNFLKQNEKFRRLEMVLNSHSKSTPLECTTWKSIALHILRKEWDMVFETNESPSVKKTSLKLKRFRNWHNPLEIGL